MAIYVASSIMYGSTTFGGSLLVPFPAFILAAITASVSLVGYFVKPPEKYVSGLSFFNYLLLGTTSAYLVASTGVTTSPFIALWMLVAIFAGLFGAYGIIAALLAVNGYLLATFLAGSTFARPDIVIYIMAGELPILVSYLIWHSRRAHQSEQSRALNELTAELTEVSDQSRVVINAIADGVIALDNRGFIQLINPAAQSMLGWTEKDALKLDFKSVLKITDSKGQPLPDGTDIISRVLTTNKTSSDNNAGIITNSGKQLIVSIVASPSGLGESGVIIVLRDITQQKTEEREQAEFISTASHEMRTPVASIEGYLGLALNPSTATIDDKARTYLEKAHESAQHLGRLFQDLLDVSRVEDGRMKNDLTVVEASEFTASIVQDFELAAKKKNLMLYFKPGTVDTLSADAGHKLSPVFYTSADTDHLREVLGNLVENAIKYTPQGSVTVDVTADDAFVTISIKDSGIGIPPEDVSHLFQKFYRVDNSATREIGGTGLGLFLCRRLVESMNGKIWVESEFGKGSTFFVQFARIPTEEAMSMIESETPIFEPEKATVTQPITENPSTEPTTAQPRPDQAVAATPPLVEQTPEIQTTSQAPEQNATPQSLPSSPVRPTEQPVEHTLSSMPAPQLVVPERHAEIPKS